MKSTHFSLSTAPSLVLSTTTIYLFGNAVVSSYFIPQWPDEGLEVESRQSVPYWKPLRGSPSTFLTMARKAVQDPPLPDPIASSRSASPCSPCAPAACFLSVSGTQKTLSDLCMYCTLSLECVFFLSVGVAGVFSCFRFQLKHHSLKTSFSDRSIVSRCFTTHCFPSSILLIFVFDLTVCTYFLLPVWRLASCLTPTLGCGLHKGRVLMTGRTLTSLPGVQSRPLRKNIIVPIWIV